MREVVVLCAANHWDGAWFADQQLALAEGIPDGTARILTRRPTHAEIARSALVSRERASKALSSLRAQGAVSYGRRGPLRVLVPKLQARLQRM